MLAVHRSPIMFIFKERSFTAVLAALALAGLFAALGSCGA